MINSKLKEEIMELLLKTVEFQSHTGTKREREIENYLLDYISNIEYFKNRSTQYDLRKLDNDPLQRGFIWAYYKGTGSKTIILLNHHDVVDSFDYGSLSDIAYYPEKLKKQLIKLDFNKNIMDDLSSKDWLFGRGTADMKAGLAIQLSILKQICSSQRLASNILFVSVPDEESLSAGMRNCSKFLVELKEKLGFDYKLVINSEPHERSDKNSYRIYEGSVGKTMAFVYVRGKKTHIGDIFNGINPSLILSNILLKTEVNSKFSDKSCGQISPPPSWSFARDFKKRYDASVPLSAGGYLSFLTLNKTPKEILLKLKEICHDSLLESISQIKSNYTELYNKEFIGYKPKVKLYSELYDEAINNNKEKTIDDLNRVFSIVSKRINDSTLTIPESNFYIVEALLENIEDNNPTVIIGLSPPYYPHISNNIRGFKLDLNHLQSICSNYFSNNLQISEYFMGISDLSYLGLQDSDKVIPYIQQNMPLLLNNYYTIPLEEMKQLNLPVVNIGPWGQDYHKLTERVYLPDVIGQTPMLILETIKMI